MEDWTHVQSAPIRSIMCSDTVTVHTSILFDPKSKAFVNDVSITVSKSTGLVTKIHQRSKAESDALDTAISQPDIDLRSPGPDGKKRVVLPGFVDSHTHIFLHDNDTPALNQMRDESPAERVIRAVNHCRTALMAGYTTYRDLGTEGMRDDDTHVRDAVNRGVIPGPRLFVATECIASSGGYEVRVENTSNGTIRLSDVANGVDGVRAAVRRRLGAGADVIKFYADYRKRQLRYPPPAWPGQHDIQFPPAQEHRNPNCLLFNQDEMNAIVAEAKASRAPVASHAQGAEGQLMAVKAGVTTLEHGLEPSDEVLKAMKKQGTIFVPTLAVIEVFYDVEPSLVNVKKAHSMGVKIAAGGDTGAIAHGDNVREIELLLQAGLSVEEALTAATLHGWEACGGDWCGRRFGWLAEGTAADIIALEGDPREDISALRRIDFVMKDARVWKQDGMSADR